VYHSFIGIDISKDEFHVAIFGNEKVSQYKNNKHGFKKLCDEHNILSSLVVLEATGGYEDSLIKYLHECNIAVHKANPKVIKSFIRSLCKLGKSDKIDARGLARYAKERHEDLHQHISKSDVEQELLELTNRRIELKQMLTQEKNRLKGPANNFCKNSNNTIISAIETEIERLKIRLKDLLDQNEKIKAKVKLLADEIAGVGETTAISLISLFPELGELNRRQVASLGGVAPHPYESGKKIGYRQVRGGRQFIKPILFMSALTAARSKGNLGDFYRRLIANGKKPMVALVAVMRKILVIANAKLKVA